MDRRGRVEAEDDLERIESRVQRMKEVVDDLNTRLEMDKWIGSLLPSHKARRTIHRLPPVLLW